MIEGYPVIMYPEIPKVILNISVADASRFRDLLSVSLDLPNFVSEN